MKKYTINCDMGEGIYNEAAIMPFIDYCNIACGGHTGDASSMLETIVLALKNKVMIGAHPSYPDKINFGRESIKISNKELIESIRKQVNDLIEIAASKNTKLSHIKPHGALYNDIVKNKKLAQVFIEAITPYKNILKLFVPFDSEIERIAIINDVNIIYEVFADRNYNQDLSLVSRSQRNAVIENLNILIKNCNEVITIGKINTIQNSKVSIKAETFCIHSDTNNALEFIKGLKKVILSHTNE